MNDMRQPVPAAPAEAPPAPTAPPVTGSRTRRRLLLLLAIVVVIGAAIWFVAGVLLAPAKEETEDAYVAGDIVQITARDPGTVLAIRADDTQTVKAGQLLVALDPATSDVNLASAEAELARAVRATRADFTRVNQGDAGIAQATAALAAARADLGRRSEAAREGAVSGEELAHARDAVTVAAANLNLARSQRAQAIAGVGGTDTATNPAVLAAAAAYRRAAIARSHMTVSAPIDGVVARRTVQLGQQIAAGQPLMTLVALDRLWVDANFRETQLKDLRIGQPATVVADMYGDDIVYHGRVEGLAAGSGNAFALLPPQNASGNWIKIVQRVPVRIRLNPEELRRNPLRVGLSVTATVDTADKSGMRVGRPAAHARPAGGEVETADPAVDARIARIIAANR